jgi:hypothetical protein
MSKCDNPINALCSCKMENLCDECKIKPWRVMIGEYATCAAKQYIEALKHMPPQSYTNLEEELKEAGFDAIRRHHEERKQTNLASSVLTGMKVAFSNYVERRKHLMQEFAIPATEKVIAQHFLYLSSSPDSPSTLDNYPTCEWCVDNEYFEPFPPKHFREWMTQLILHAIDRKHLNSHVLKKMEADNTARLVFHLWLNRLHAREKKETVGEHVCTDYDDDCNCSSATCQCCLLCCLDYV